MSSNANPQEGTAGNAQEKKERGDRWNLRQLRPITENVNNLMVLLDKANVEPVNGRLTKACIELRDEKSKLERMDKIIKERVLDNRAIGNKLKELSGIFLSEEHREALMNCYNGRSKDEKAAAAEVLLKKFVEKRREVYAAFESPDLVNEIDNPPKKPMKNENLPLEKPKSILKPPKKEDDC